MRKLPNQGCLLRLRSLCLLCSSFGGVLSAVAGPSVELQRPLSVQHTQGPELQRHGVRTRAGRVLVPQGVVVVVLDRFALRVEREGPEAIQMDLLTEAGGQRVHEETRGWTLDVDVVGQPITVDKNI